MGKYDDKIAFYKNEMERLKLECELDLLDKITRDIGPSIFKTDAETVSGSDARELDTVKRNFLIKKHGLTDSKLLDETISKVVTYFGKSNRNKYRAIFYYLLVKELNLEDKY